jgi:hypothetical protein
MIMDRVNGRKDESPSELEQCQKAADSRADV